MRRDVLNWWFAVIIVASLATGCLKVDHPGEVRRCECEHLREWLAGLPLASEGMPLEGITVSEDLFGFSMTASLPASQLPPEQRERIIAVFEDSGLGLDVVADTEESWRARFGPRNRSADDTDWWGRINIERGLTLAINVMLDPEPYGYDEIFDLQEFYRTDRETALANQDLRQMEAIELLEPLRTVAILAEAN